MAVMEYVLYLHNNDGNGNDAKPNTISPLRHTTYHKQSVSGEATKWTCIPLIFKKFNLIITSVEKISHFYLPQTSSHIKKRISKIINLAT